MTIEVPVTHTKTGFIFRALVDDEDEWLVAPYAWKLHETGGPQYARATVERKSVHMHHMIIGKHPILDVDHIDGNGLNNTRANLRFLTRAKNLFAGRTVIPAGHAMFPRLRKPHIVRVNGRTYCYAWRGGPRITQDEAEARLARQKVNSIPKNL